MNTPCHVTLHHLPRDIAKTLRRVVAGRMQYNPDLHHRRSIRLRDYDYANAGAYFVMVCLNQRILEWLRNADKIADANFEFPMFGIIENDVMMPNECGKIVQMVWNELPLHYENSSRQQWELIEQYPKF